VNSKVVLANNKPIPCILLANKCDLADATIDEEALDNFVKEHNFILWQKTSAQDDIGIDDAMKVLIAEILKVSKENAPQQRPKDAIMLDKNNTSNNDTNTQNKTENNQEGGCCS